MSAPVSYSQESKRPWPRACKPVMHIGGIHIQAPLGTLNHLHSVAVLGVMDPSTAGAPICDAIEQLEKAAAKAGFAVRSMKVEMVKR